MRDSMVEEFLRKFEESKGGGVRFVTIGSRHVHEPGDGTLNKTSRNGDRKNPILTPYSSVVHVLHQQVLFGADYAKMVNNQRKREADAKVAEAMEALSESLPGHVKVDVSVEVEEFLAEQLWRGKGCRDERFPKYAAFHKDTLERYLVCKPLIGDNGKPVPKVSIYMDQDGKVLDFKKDLEEFWKKPSSQPLAQGTDQQIFWSTLKFRNITSISCFGQEWEDESQS